MYTCAKRLKCTGGYKGDASVGEKWVDRFVPIKRLAHVYLCRDG